MHPETIERTSLDFAHHIDSIRKHYLDGYLIEDEIAEEQANLGNHIEILRPGIELQLNIPIIRSNVITRKQQPYKPRPPIKQILQPKNRNSEMHFLSEIKGPIHYSLLTEDDIKKIKEFTVPYDDPSLTVQDIQFIQYMILNSEESDIYDIALQINPEHRELEVEYLKSRYKTLNYLLLKHLNLKLEMNNQEDESLITLVNKSNINLENLWDYLSLMGEKNIKDRHKRHLVTSLFNDGKNSLISARSVDGKNLKPLVLNDVKLVELPFNATKDDSGKGIVIITDDNEKQEIRKVNTTTTEVDIGWQIRLINILLTYSSISREMLYAKFSTGEEPLSSRTEQLLIYSVNKIIRSWGVEASYDESRSQLTLQLAGDKDPHLPEPIKVSYEEDNAIFANRQRKRKPSHAKMRL